MTAKTETETPTLTPALIGAMRSFSTAASTNAFGLELLWGRWLELRQASAANLPDDPFADVKWSAVCDLVTQHRASHRGGDSTPFDILTAITRRTKA